MKKNGFTLIELVIVLAIVLTLVLAITSVIVNNMGATEKRAYAGASTFITNNSLITTRLTCAGDSDNDGYGTCAVTLTNKDRIRLSCPTDWFNVKVGGATNCKEVFNDINF